MFCLFLGHKFQARYSIIFPRDLSIQGLRPENVSASVEALKEKIYEGDVCVHCGIVVNKPFKTSNFSFPWVNNGKSDKENN